MFVIALSVTVLALAGCGGDDGADASTTPSSPRTAPTSLDAGFETGTTGGWSDVARARVSPEAARTGSFGLDVVAAGSDAYVSWDAGATGTDRPFWSLRAWVRVVAWTPGESVDLFTVRNLEITNNFDLFVGATDRAFQWDLFRENSARAPGTVELGRWYLVEARGSFATRTSTAEVRIDGVRQPSIASPGQPPSAVRELVLGSMGTKKTNRVQFDDVRFAVGDRPLPLPGPPAVQP